MRLHRIAVFVPALCALSLAVCVSPRAMAAPGLDVYAQSAGGQSNLGAAGPPFSCATFGPDPRSAGFNGGYRVSLPTDGPICGVVSDTQSRVGAAGPLATAAAVNNSFGTPADARSFTGSAAARASYGDMGVRANGSYAGTSDPFVVSGSGAGALQREVFTFSGASGGGTFRPTFTLDGDFYTQGRTENEIVFSYAIGLGPIFTAFRIQDARGSLTLYTPGGYVAALPGMVVSGNNTVGQRITGSTRFQLDIPIVYGTPLEMTYALWAGVLPSSSVGQAGPSHGDASFYSSLRLTGIQLFDASGQALSAFGVGSGSGTLYGPTGVVPEPATFWSMGVGMLALALLRSRRLHLEEARR